MERTPGANKYRELKERTFLFAKRCRDYVKKLSRTVPNFEYGKQLIRSSGSQAANYIEANESLSRKDFAHRIKICRKETKESCLWLNLAEPEESAQPERRLLLEEARALRKIFSSILEKSK